MPLWKRGNAWRWQFQAAGRRYAGSAPTKAQARSDLETFRKKIQMEATLTGMVFSTLSNEYLDYSKRRHAKKTYQYKTIVYRNFLNFAGDLPVEKITLGLLESYLSTRVNNTSYNRHRKDLCALFNWAWRRRYLTDNPCHFLEKLPEPKYVRCIPTQEEMTKIILAAGEHRPLLLVLYHTLARIDEVLRLRWDDVNLTERTVRLWTRKRRDGAWDYDLLPMNQVLYETLGDLWRKRLQDEWVFFNPQTGTRYNSRPKLMKTICRNAGVPYYGFHAIRHYVASRLHDVHKWSTAKVGRLLRHQNKQTTERYLQIIDPGLFEVMASLEENLEQPTPQPTPVFYIMS